ncbi:MAG TPA: ABC transporter [Microscillaceae bacterium]|nr:ABC transporter [Microscillaceae bacterium]
MNYQENIREGLRSVRANLLRSILTALIIAIGIMALVGILTAIDGIQASVDDSFAQLGVNSFDIEGTSSRGRRRRRGRNEKVYPPIKYKQAKNYQERLGFPAKVSITTNLTGAAEIKFRSKKTNPNSRVVGANENYIITKGYNLKQGRNFSPTEITKGVNVGIIGHDLANTLFEKENPLNKLISVLGKRIRVIGVLKKIGGSFGGSGNDRSILIPIELAYRIPTRSQPTYNITTSLDGPMDFMMAMGEAESLMRQIRQDKLGQPNSFQIERSESAADRLGNITGYLTIGGGVVGFITLLGASIGLMNIMLVSVTERTREIGVRKALGATPKRIRQQFLIEAIVICLMGGTVGIIFGILIGNVLSLVLGSSGFIIPWSRIVIGLVTCIGVGSASGYYPAYKASKLDPIESLRFE